ncbi:MAG: NUDIX hydrolase [Acidobacteriaceae bacterium]
MVGCREYPAAPIVGVGAIVIEGGNVLLVRRAREPFLGQWSLPGGAVELGETLERAVVREVEEETGLAVAPVSVLKALDRIERDTSGRVRFHYVLVDFLCKPTETAEEPLAASDASDAQWVPIVELRKSKLFALPDETIGLIEDGWRKLAKM